jgi:hypothetical protein
MPERDAVVHSTAFKSSTELHFKKNENPVSEVLRLNKPLMEERMAISRKSSTLTFGTLYLKLESKHGKARP